MRALLYDIPALWFVVIIMVVITIHGLRRLGAWIEGICDRKIARDRAALDESYNKTLYGIKPMGSADWKKSDEKFLSHDEMIEFMAKYKGRRSEVCEVEIHRSTGFEDRVPPRPELPK